MKIPISHFLCGGCLRKRALFFVLFLAGAAGAYAQKPSFEAATGTYTQAYDTEYDIPKGTASLNGTPVAGRVITALNKGSLSGTWKRSDTRANIVLNSNQYFVVGSLGIYFDLSGNEDTSTGTKPSITFKAFNPASTPTAGPISNTDAIFNGNALSDDTFTVTVTVLPPQKPVLDNTQGLTAINMTVGEDPAEIRLIEAGHLSDVQQEGVKPVSVYARVITGFSSGSLSGTWQYKPIDNWVDLPTLSNGKYFHHIHTRSAIGPSILVRFAPSGTEDTEGGSVTKPTITIKGANLGRASISLTGSTPKNIADLGKAVSAEEMTLTVTIKPANAPKLGASTLFFGDAFLLTATSDTNGTLYWVIQEGASASPSATQVRALQDHTGTSATHSGQQALSASTATNIALRDLGPGAYRVYFLVENSANLQSHLGVESITVTPDQARTANNQALLNDLPANLDQIGTRNKGQSDSLKRHEGEITALETSQATQTTDISALETSQATQTTDISELKTSQSNLQSRVRILENTSPAAAQHARFVAIEDRNDGQSDSLSRHDTEIKILEGSQGNQNTYISDLQTRMHSLETSSGPVAVQNNRFIAIESRNEGQSDSLTRHDAEITRHDTEITALEATLQTKIAALEAEIERIKGHLFFIYHTPGAQSSGQVRAYPNPVTKRVRFTGLVAGVRYPYKIYTSTGTLLRSGTLQKDETINLSALPQGAYLVTLHTEAGEEVLKSSLIVKSSYF